jgi:hypothetical protein
MGKDFSIETPGDPDIDIDELNLHLGEDSVADKQAAKDIEEAIGLSNSASMFMCILEEANIPHTDFGILKYCNGAVNYTPQSAVPVGTWNRYGDGTLWIGLSIPMEKIAQMVSDHVKGIAGPRAFELLKVRGEVKLKETKKPVAKKEKSIVPKPAPISTVIQTLTPTATTPPVAQVRTAEVASSLADLLKNFE